MSFTQLRGLMKVSGIEVVYDTSKPEYHYLVSLQCDGRDVQDDDRVLVGVSGIIARGCDHYDAFLEGNILETFEPLGELTIDYYRARDTVPLPTNGRQHGLAAEIRD